LTVAGFGEYERLPFMPTIVITTSDAAGVGVGVGDAGLMEPLLPQPPRAAATSSKPPIVSVIREFIVLPPSADVALCPAVWRMLEQV
jgi:hypothetical protein